MSNTLAITSDRGAVLSPRKLAIQADALTPLAVTFDAATIALFGRNPVFRLDFRLPDGTEVYVGSYSVAASVAVTLPASVFAQEGGLTVQARVTDDAGLVWHSLEAEAFISDAIEAGTPASADTRVYVETPATFTAGNLAGYDATSGKLMDSGVTTSDLAVASSKVKFTTDGGLAVLLTNRTGAPSVKGAVVHASSSYNSAVELIVKDVPDPVGAFLDTGVASGSDAWVVVSGIADVYFVGSTTRGYVARGFLTADGASYVVGEALAEAVPSSPFATDKHFYEIGHVLESRTGAGLAKTLLHFN